MQRVTQSFRREHARLRQQVAEVHAWVRELSAADVSAPLPLALRVEACFETHIVPNAGWKERVLYPAVDRYAGSSPDQPFTASMRHQHRIVERWLADLRAFRGQGDWATFARRADQLLGLVEAHLEAEEKVLLPILDLRMSQDAWAAEIGAAPG